MLSKDFATNITRSFAKFVKEKLGATYYINYSARSDEALEKRVKEGLNDYWRWVDLYWLRIGPGIFSTSMLQINCNTIIAKDPYASELSLMRDEVIGELNVDQIDLYDFSSNPNNPESTGNVIVPRFRGSRPLPEAAAETVNVELIEYNVYVWRESVLP